MKYRHDIDKEVFNFIKKSFTENNNINENDFSLYKSECKDKKMEISIWKHSLKNNKVEIFFKKYNEHSYKVDESYEMSEEYSRKLERFFEELEDKNNQEYLINHHKKVLDIIK